MTADPPPHFHASTLSSSNLRVATYNIHKGVRGVGPRKRLEIHNLVLGIEALDTDLVFLQEVRRMNRAAADKCFSPSNAEAVLQLPRFID